MDKNRYISLLTAIFLGVLTYFLSDVLFLFTAFGIISYFIYKQTPEEDRNFVLAVLVAGFFIRVILAVMFHASNYIKGYHCLSGDDLLFTIKSWAMVYKWEGKSYIWVNDLSGASPNYGLNSFSYLLAAFYKFFGFHPLSSKFINCIIGALTGWVVYILAKNLFDSRTAKISMAIAAFYPSLIRWSIANLKDQLMIFLFMLAVYICVYALYEKIPLWFLFVLSLSTLALFFFPQKTYFAFMILIIVLSVILRHIFTTPRAISYMIFTGAAASFYFICINPAPLIKLLYRCEFQQLIVARSEYAGYYMYTKGFLEMLNKGVIDALNLGDVLFRNIVYFLLTPFPWQMTSRERLLSFPQMIIWYPIVIFSIFGFLKLISIKLKAAIVIGVLLAVGIIVTAMAEGNIGSSFRHRDLFTPFFIILAAVVIKDIFCKNSIKNQ